VRATIECDFKTYAETSLFPRCTKSGAITAFILLQFWQTQFAKSSNTLYIILVVIDIIDKTDTSMKYESQLGLQKSWSYGFSGRDPSQLLVRRHAK